MKKQRIVLLTTFLSAVMALSAVPAAAQQRDIDFGLRLGAWLEDADPVVGLEVITPIASRIYFNPNVEFLFRDKASDRVIVNADAHYDFPTRPDRFLWAGAGAAGLFGGGTDFGLNLLGGYGWDMGTYVPYVQGKLVIADDTNFEAAVGVRF